MSSNQNKISRLRGTQDIYGDTALLFQKIEQAAIRVFERYSFGELETPILEEKQLFVRALGTETDVVQKEMYEFEDRSKTQVAMRPEGTAGVVRAYLENNFDKNEGLCKFYYRGPMFRSERPQAGRLRQFHQIGVEELGTSSPYADAEVILSLCAFLEEAGATGFELKLNNLGTFEERTIYKEKLREFFKPQLKRLCEDCQKRFEKNVFRILDCKNPDCRKAISDAPTIESYLTEESKSHFDTVKSCLEAAGVKYKIDARMVRGLDYYTKTVFEVTHSKLGAQDALGAGGRYDQLIESFGGPSVGAVGFAVGVERLCLCLKSEEAISAETTTSFYVATLGPEALKAGFKILQSLRVEGLSAQMDFEAKSLKSQLRSADKAKSRYVIILGEEEMKKNICLFKDMAAKTQEEVGLKELLSICRDKK